MPVAPPVDEPLRLAALPGFAPGLASGRITDAGNRGQPSPCHPP